jgi:hypothetical protein
MQPDLGPLLDAVAELIDDAREVAWLESTPHERRYDLLRLIEAVEAAVRP